MASEYRSFVLSICNNISRIHLEDLKYLCLDYNIPRGKLEEVDSPLKFVKELENYGYLGIDNFAKLQQLLTNIGCIKLAHDVEDFACQRQLELLCLEKHQGRKQVPCTGSTGTETAGNRHVENQGESGSGSSTNVTSCGKEYPLQEHGFHVQPSLERCQLCSSLCYQSELQRSPGEIYLKVVLELATKGAWIAGSAFILKRYISNPSALAGLFASVVLPSGILVKFLCKGSVVCVLGATDLHGLNVLWENFKNGTLQSALKEVLVTDELKELAGGERIVLKVDLDERMYREVCLELISVKQKVDQICNQVQQRPRSLSDPMRVYHAEESSHSTCELDSFHLIANVERKRRIRAEKRLQEHISTIPHMLQFPGLRDLKAKSHGETGSSSESSSTADEEEVLEWEDKMMVPNLFWSSIKGGIKEKPWSDFVDAVRKEFKNEVEVGGTDLLDFLAYVLKVSPVSETQVVYLKNFIRLSRWFGPFIAGPEGCLNRMMDLMNHSVSVGSDGIMNWFAGYTTDLGAKEKLRREEPGTFLIRFSTSSAAPGFILSIMSPDSMDLVDYHIEVNKETGFVIFRNFQNKQFPSLPSLVEALRMEDSPSFQSADGTEMGEKPQPL